MERRNCALIKENCYDTKRKKSFYHMSKSHAKLCTWQTKCFGTCFPQRLHIFGRLVRRRACDAKAAPSTVTLSPYDSREAFVYFFTAFSWQLAHNNDDNNVLMCYSTLVIYCDGRRPDSVSFVSIASRYIFNCAESRKVVCEFSIWHFLLSWARRAIRSDERTSH